MKAAFVILGAFVAAIVLAGILAIGSYIKYANYGVATETALVAKLNDNRQLLGKHSTQIGEMAQVNTMYRDDLSKVYADALEGRYGENGSGAVMQWIQEQNPNMDAALYTRLSQKIEANRDEFANEQRVLLDQKRAYETQLGLVWSGFWLKLAGYPKIKLEDIKVVSSTHSNKAFETGVDDGIQLRK
ncbi:hypothetical protein [Xanthomonas phage XacN1]|nr:hypothetical protein [Xanthomonas phage XacN1]